jgi:arginine-tRNA-protein transferase
MSVYINEDFFCSKVSAEELDRLLAEGWRHFGNYFFRYSFSFFDGKLYHVVPLRIKLKDFSLSKSKRRIKRKNEDLEYRIGSVEIDAEKIELFKRHKKRFRRNVPDSIYTFISPLKNVPCETMQIEVLLNNKLVAASFFDIGRESISSIYAIFEPEEKKRSLGIFTMLLEIDFAIKSGKNFYYQGYAYQESSFYDYKKRFSGLEAYNWETGKWERFNQKVEVSGL